MKTPKEKAKELIYKFNLGGNDLAKDCVDEIIKAIDWHKFETPNDEFIYWIKVKEEIENCK